VFVSFETLLLLLLLLLLLRLRSTSLFLSFFLSSFVFNVSLISNPRRHECSLRSMLAKRGTDLASFYTFFSHLLFFLFLSFFSLVVRVRRGTPGLISRRIGKTEFMSSSYYWALFLTSIFLSEPF
jgi:uncharacterized protein YneF (UPF0154 family)